MQVIAWHFARNVAPLLTAGATLALDLSGASTVVADVSAAVLRSRLHTHTHQHTHTHMNTLYSCTHVCIYRRCYGHTSTDVMIR